MNRYAWYIAVAYVGLALVSVGVYYAAVSKFIDYSETQLQFASPGTTHVANASVTAFGGGWIIVVRWQFDNEGRLPLTIAIFQFQMYVDNGSDSRQWNDDAKLASEYSAFLSFQLDRTTGLVVSPSSSAEREWTVLVDRPGDVAKVAPHSDDGKFYLVFLETRIVYYIADVDNRQMLDLDPFVMAVGP